MNIESLTSSKFIKQAEFTSLMIAGFSTGV